MQCSARNHASRPVRPGAHRRRSGPAAVLCLQVLGLLPLRAHANYALGDPSPMCWMLDSTNTPMQCPTGLEVDWAPDYRVPTRIYVGVPVLVRMSLNVTLQTFLELERLQLISKTSPNMTAAEKWQRCTQTNSPCTGGTSADNCCLFHVNVHSCLNKPGLFCGPWVGNDGQLATHTPAQTGYVGAAGQTHFDFTVKLFWEGSYTVIAHTKMAGFHFAIGITTEVQYGTSACSSPFQVPSRAGPCEDCPLGTQPLSQGIPPGARQISDDEALATGRNPLCVACPPGWISDDGRMCGQCPSGRFAQDAGSSACAACPAGRYAYEEGAKSCRPCLAGAFAPPGSFVCSSCPRGRYRPPPPIQLLPSNISTDRGDETDCLACPAPYTTLEQRSENVSACVCPEGSYELPAAPGAVGMAGCAQCTDGMECSTGALSAPLQAEGFYVQLIDQPASKGKREGEYEAYRCLPSHCPRAAAGTCAQGRVGLACGECRDFHFPAAEGECIECQSQDVLPAALGMLALVMLLSLLFIWAGADAARQRLSTLGLMCILGQTVVTVQLVSSISLMQFKLVDPLLSIASSLQFFNLNVDTIKFQCVVGSDSPVMKYAVALATYPCFAVVLVLVFGLLKCVTGRRLGVYDMVNSLGLLLTVLFLPVTVICLQPFRCASSPSGHSSVSTAASVLCGDSSHQAMLGIGVVGTLLYPVAVLGTVGGVTWFYPRLVAIGMSSELLRSCRFLYQRFTPQRYYYGVVYLARSTAVALLPVAFPEPGFYLPFCLTAAVAGVALLQGLLWPWRTPLANLNDMACGYFLVMVLAVANALADIERSMLEKQLSIILTICIAVGSIMVIVLVCVALTKVIQRFRHKRYGAFLTHHKQGAGCLARLIKLRLQPRLRSSEVFLDSDNLDDLEGLFDTVRCDTAHIIAILTEETLRRPWCAGELVTALKNGVPVTIAAHAGLQLPDEAELSNICNIWSPEELHPLHAVGVSEDDVVECYRKLAGLPRITLPRTLGSEKELGLLEQAIDEMAVAVGASAISGRGNFGRMTSPPQADNQVPKFIIANVTDPEASAAAFVLQHLVKEVTHDVVPVVLRVEDLYQASGSTAALVVVLTKGCLENPTFARLLLAAQGKWAAGAAIVSVVADKAFAFPSKEEVAKTLAPKIVQVLQKDFEMEISQETVCRCYTAVLQILALVFSSQLGMAIQNTEVAMICKRLEKGVQQIQSGSAAKYLKVTSGVEGGDGGFERQKSGGSGADSSRKSGWVSDLLGMATNSPRDLSKDRMSAKAGIAPVSSFSGDPEAAGGGDPKVVEDCNPEAVQDWEPGQQAI